VTPNRLITAFTNPRGRFVALGEKRRFWPENGFVDDRRGCRPLMAFDAAINSSNGCERHFFATTALSQGFNSTESNRAQWNRRTLSAGEAG
jgi:hypothetical protein